MVKSFCFFCDGGGERIEGVIFNFGVDVLWGVGDECCVKVFKVFFFGDEVWNDLMLGSFFWILDWEVLMKGGEVGLVLSKGCCLVEILKVRV